MASNRQLKYTRSMGINPNAWMITFSDLIMLLLTFFVLLLTMKTMDNKVLEKMFRKTTTARGPLEFVETRISGDVSEKIGFKQKTVMVEESDTLKKAFEILEGLDSIKTDDQTIKKIQESIEIEEDSRGVIVTLASDRLFEPGEAEINADNTFILDAAGRLLKNAGNNILIMGHTDNTVPGGVKFESNWELSFYRALSVYFYLSDSAGLRSEKMAVGGYGDVKPRFSNDSEINRAKNRRVEFVLKKQDLY